MCIRAETVASCSTTHGRAIWFPTNCVTLGFQLYHSQGLHGYPKRLIYLHVAE